MNTTFGIIGGDKRQLYLARSIMKDGYNVYVSGFELSSDTVGIAEIPLDKLVEVCDNIILPLPSTMDGVTVFAPYSEEAIVADDEFIMSLVNKNVYGGLMNKLVMGNDLWSYINYSDYYLCEEFTISNAAVTAEGAIAIAVHEHPGMLCRSKCLVTGYGRIGKILSKMLTGIGADVTVAARKAKDIALIRAMGDNPKKYQDITDCYDIIFNTVPEVVISRAIIERQNNSTVIIELASLPGGVDRKAAGVKGIKVVDAQSLPGKVAPKAAGEFIKEAIYNMLES